jgi:hypothetical protein
MGDTLNLQESEASQMGGPGMRNQHKQAFSPYPMSRFTSPTQKDPAGSVSARESPSWSFAEKHLPFPFSIRIPAMLLRAPLARPLGPFPMRYPFLKAFIVSPMFVGRTRRLTNPGQVKWKEWAICIYFA